MDVCTDLMTDPSNCGSCGHACPGTCSAGACQCATQSSSNLLFNAGFDGDVTEGWTPYDPKIVLSRGTIDSSNCKLSGSLLVTNQDPEGLNSGAYQCVPVTAGLTYDTGAWINTPSGLAKGQANLMLEYYTGDNCSGNVTVGSLLFTYDTDAWEYVHKENLTVPADVRSAAVYLQVVKNGPNEKVFSAYYDSIYLTPSPGKF
jgi:hypothetical protein